MNSLSRLIILIALSLFKTGIAQVFDFNVYTEDNGLSQNYIYSISQSEDGYLYMATGNGFSSFEGKKFKTYSIKDSLAENFVNHHFIDSRKTVWLGHYQNGISYLKDGVINKIKKSEELGSKIISFTEDSKKNIWFAVQGKGVYYIDTSYTLKGPILSEDEGVNYIKADISGNLLCATNNGLNWYNTQNPTKLKLISKLALFENKTIKYIIRDAQNASIYWVTLPGEGVFGIKLLNKKIQLISTITDALESESKTILSIYSDHETNLWISLANEGLKKIIFPRGNDKTKYTVNSIGKENGLPSNYIQSIFEDFEYNMWFGSFGNGLIELPTFKFNFYKPDLASDIKSIYADSSDYIWLGTSSGLLKYYAENKTKTKLFGSSNGFVNDEINAIHKDKNGKFWLATELNGVYTFEPTTEKFENFSLKNKLSSLSINCITQTKGGTIFIGTKEGVYFIDPDTKNITLLTTSEGLMHNNVKFIFCDSKARIWFCSDGTPPYFLQNDEITVLKDIPELKSYAINSVSEDLKGLIWISTNGDGIFTYDGKTTKNLRVENGLISNFCYSAIVNYNNDIWVTHKNGMSQIKGIKQVITTYKKTDGLLFTKNNLNAGFSDMKGNVWFGSEDGLTNYNTQKNKISIPEPKTQILSLILNDNNYLSIALNEKTDSTADQLSLEYDDYNVKIEVLGISLTAAEEVLYKYRLLGVDTIWRTTDERIIEFPLISDGEYTFQIYASNRDGIWNSQPTEIRFTIRPPFWKRVWFWLLSIITLGGIVYYYLRTRINNLLKIKLRLESTVKEKTYQLQIEKEQIESIKIVLEEKNKDITDSINYAKRIQESLLPSQESFISSFPKSFIFFKPRDIVSGDFYWFAETEESYIVAAVDCTGHGIPGAFMSIIGTNILTDIVLDKKITTPSEILNQLNLNITKLLKQDVVGSTSRDGMDVSICAINKEKTKMLYSSASRPMYYVRAGVVNEVNLRSFSIGGSYDEYVKTFTDVEIEILPNDVYYLFTDGYADQFDKNDLKKFSVKRLKELFTKIAEEDSQNQYNALDQALYDWKGTTKQIDDITVIGVKI